MYVEHALGHERVQFFLPDAAVDVIPLDLRQRVGLLVRSGHEGEPFSKGFFTQYSG